MLKVLFIEDDDLDIQLAVYQLGQDGVQVKAKTADSPESFKREVGEGCPDVIISDHGLATFDVFHALKLSRETCPEIPFIVLSGGRHPEERTVLLEGGADAYVLKSQLHTLANTIIQLLDSDRLGKSQ